jgi:CheY-like chemotaxis protein
MRHQTQSQPVFVLVADSNADSRTLYCNAFWAQGWTCLEAEDGREALTHVATRLLSLCFAELHLPIIDGIALCKKIRVVAPAASLPIMIVAPRANEEDLVQATLAGANAVLDSTVRLEDVVQTAALLMHSRALQYHLRHV